MFLNRIKRYLGMLELTQKEADELKAIIDAITIKPGKKDAKAKSASGKRNS